MVERICVVESCTEEGCPKRGVVQRMNKEGVMVKYPFCYEKCREIPDVIGTEGFEDFPDWCPLEVRDGKR